MALIPVVLYSQVTSKVNSLLQLQCWHEILLLESVRPGAYVLLVGSLMACVGDERSTCRRYRLICDVLKVTDVCTARRFVPQITFNVHTPQHAFGNAAAELHVVRRNAPCPQSFCLHQLRIADSQKISCSLRFAYDTYQHDEAASKAMQWATYEIVE